MLPLNPDQIKRTFQEALKAQASGDLEGAEKRFRMILGAAPKLPEVHFQLGRIAAARNQLDQALDHLQTARDLKPSEPAIWQAMAEVLAARAKPRETADFLSAAKSARIAPKLLLALQNRLSPPKRGRKMKTGSADPKAIQAAVAALQQGKIAEAESQARRLLKAHPDLPVLHHVLGSALGGQGQLDKARSAFETALKLDPDYAEVRDLYGRILMQTGDLDGAVAAFQRALKSKPDYVPALGNLGLALADKGETDTAIICLRRALDANPKQPEIRLALGTQLAHAKQPEEAVAILNEALKQGDDRTLVHLRLAEAYARAGQNDDAERHFTIAESRDDIQAAVLSVHAMHLQSLGKFDAAEQRFRRAIELEPRNGEHYRTFGATHKLKADDPLLSQMEELFQDPTLEDGSRMHLGFALARAMEQIKAHDRVFTYLRPANDLMARRYPFDLDARARIIKNTQAAFADTDFNRPEIEGATDYAPIFVTGMPRSGTTLVEQILSSHSTVTGAGEVGFAVPLISRAMVDPQGGGYFPFGSLPDDQIRGFGDEIAAHLRKLAPDTPRVSDKSIQTYMLMGAIKLAMPRARFVLVRRDPRDLLFSIYKNFFREGTHAYAYDLKTLGLYYRQFEEMVTFWRKKLPGGFHEIHYEELIAAPEDETRKLLAASDLDWEDACLSFHENKRQISTLSLHQARQPIYTSSMQAWKRHEDELAELIEALGDVI